MNESINSKRVFLFLFFSVGNVRCENLENRLKMYRKAYMNQRKENASLRKVNRKLRRKIKAHEDFLFGPLMTMSIDQL